MIYKKETPFDRLKFGSLVVLEEILRKEITFNPLLVVNVLYKEIVKSLKFKVNSNPSLFLPEGIVE